MNINLLICKYYGAIAKKYIISFSVKRSTFRRLERRGNSMKKPLITLIIAFIIILFAACSAKTGKTEVTHLPETSESPLVTGSDNDNNLVTGSDNDNNPSPAKSKYDEAIELYEKGLYLQAYNTFSEVEWSDENYDDAVLKKESAKGKYISTIADKATAAKTENEVNDALTLINSALEFFPDDDKLIDSKKLCSSKLESIRLANVEDAAQKQYNSDIEYISADVNASNWASATEKFISRANNFVTTYKDYVTDIKTDYSSAKFISSHSPAIANLLNQYSDKLEELYDINYKNQVLGDANREFVNNKDYASAIRIINKYLSTCDDISAIMNRIVPQIYWVAPDDVYEQLDYYRQFIPVHLSDIDTYGNDGLEGFQGNNDLYERWSEDANGMRYDSAQTLFSWVYIEKPYISYYLNGKFDTLTLTLFNPRECLSRTSFKYQPYFRIYGDDILLYEAPRIDKEHNSPFDVSVNVTGVRVLRIEMKGMYTGTGTDVPCIAATGWELKKNIP